MALFKRSRPAPGAAALQTARPAPPEGTLGGIPLLSGDCALYDRLREAVPIVDSALLKIVRLTVDFEVDCADAGARRELCRFAQTVSTGPGGRGLRAFACSYLDSLLTYGNAVGEMVLSPGGRELAALYNAPLDNLELRPGPSPLEAALWVRGPAGEALPVKRPQLILHSALNPRPGQVIGQPLLKGLPSIASILLKIYRSVGQNFERMGSLRYAVTYRPAPGSADALQSKDIARSIAREWSAAMSGQDTGTVRDFVAVGDVDVRVIGADSQALDTEVPVRQMLEELVAKLGLPPFLLGLSWSTTERMSRQQADILTSELESYRALLTPVLTAVCTTFLRLRGHPGRPVIRWSNISLQDESELAAARLTNARAAQIEQTLKEAKS